MAKPSTETVTNETFTILIENESRKIRESLGAKNYEAAKRWARELALTLRALNAEMEARKK